MHNYRVRFRSHKQPWQIVKADAINGFDTTSDSYTFTLGQDVSPSSRRRRY